MNNSPAMPGKLTFVTDKFIELKKKKEITPGSIAFCLSFCDRYRGQVIFLTNEPEDHVQSGILDYPRENESGYDPRTCTAATDCTSLAPLET